MGMRIANVMFGRGRGGIEQAFLDYNEALLMAGHEVLAITHPLALMNTQITGQLEHATVSNYGNWDIFSAKKLAKIYRNWKPDVMISHGNRALNLNHAAAESAMHLGVTHNYQLKHFGKVDAVFATTQSLESRVLELFPHMPVARIPNMVRLAPGRAERAPGPIVIGAMGRMVAKKGFDLLLQAMQKLHAQQPDVKLLLGGDGPLLRVLKKQVKESGLQEVVTFAGWVEDKTTFFEQVDIFCLPSLHEPFGIVLLEAMAHHVPVISFASEGPRDIIQHDEAWLIAAGDVDKLAEALAKLAQSEADRAALRERGHALVENNYAMPVISQHMDKALQAFSATENRVSSGQ
jgi:glycosyltransferase involved in cell wall biosynthesis